MTRTSFFQDMLSAITDQGRRLLPLAGSVPDGAEGLAAACDTLLSTRGEASGVALARQILDGFQSLETPEQLAFYHILAERYDPDPEAVKATAEAYANERTPETLNAMVAAVEPPRAELLRRLNLAPGGTVALVEMRRRLLPHLRGEPALAGVDADFKRLFVSWFNRGFLVMQHINWMTPAHILERIIAYEAVHEIEGWDDLRRRLQPSDRRCFAFFHPSLVDDPLIFVEVALTDAIPGNIADVLSEDREVQAGDKRTVAVFYSISNCQDGLRGISFGNFLIKQVVEDLKAAVPSLKTFVTLSPVPRFREWLKTSAMDDTATELQRDAQAALARLDDVTWPIDEEQTEQAKAALMPLASEYFLRAKRSGNLPFDPVARFHLGNGARLERINWLGDVSEKGLGEAVGLMVNYLYDLDTIETNHEALATSGKIATTRAVRSTLPNRKTKTKTSA